MITAVAAFIALLMIFAPGFGATMLLLKKSPVISCIELIALSWLLGALFISLALAGLGMVFSGLALQWLVTLAALAGGGYGIKLLGEKRNAITWPRPASVLEATLCAVLLAEFMAMLFMAWRESLGWDGLLVWEIKARYAFLNGGHLPLRYFTDATRLWSHPDYPLFLPMLETWLYLWIGDCDQFWVRIIFPPFYIAGAFMLYIGASRLSGKKWAGLLAAVLLFFIPCALTGPGNLLSGYADFPLAVFYLAATVWFLLHQREKSLHSIILFAFMAGAMPWIKREGIILWACVMAPAIFEFAKQRKFPSAIFVTLSGLTLYLAWNITTKLLKAPPNSDFLPLTSGALRGLASRYQPIAHATLRELATLSHWSLLWIILPVALLCLAIKSSAKLALHLSISIALPLIIYSGIYILSSWPSYMDHLQFSLPRLVLQMSLTALLALSLAAGIQRHRP